MLLQQHLVNLYFSAHNL